LYKNRLKEKVIPITGEVEIEWLKIKQAINETAEESIGF
jgi:tRNA(Ser,Leu) C12 N-acetylase TAN1